MINHSMTNKLCLNCDKEFSVRTAYVKIGRGKFCSRSCAGQHTNNKKYFGLVCKECHKEFQSNCGWSKFCSTSCRENGKKTADMILRAKFLKERGVSRSSLYFRKNKERVYEQRRKLRENPDYVEKQRKYHREYRNKNIEAALKREAAYREKEREKIYARQVIWLKNNRDKHLEHVKRYNDKRLGTPLGRFEASCRSRMKNAFKKKGFKKNSKTQKMLCCSFEELRYHIEAKFKKGMTWENYGHWSFGASPEREWVGDHIVPLDLAETEEELIALNHYSNLQPLWSTENASKSNKLILDMISPENKIRYKEIIERAEKQRSR